MMFIQLLWQNLHYPSLDSVRELLIRGNATAEARTDFESGIRRGIGACSLSLSLSLSLSRTVQPTEKPSKATSRKLQPS
jgi:hypothetical protein